jgi:hypothetical protein
MPSGAAQLRLAIILLWAGVVLGALNIGFHAWLTWSSGGPANAVSPILATAAVFIFVQSQLVLKLRSGNPAVRKRLLLITILRLALLAPNLHELFAAAPPLAMLPVLSGLVQLAALTLLFTPPGSHRFATPAPAPP